MIDWRHWYQFDPILYADRRLYLGQLKQMADKNTTHWTAAARLQIITVMYRDLGCDHLSAQYHDECRPSRQSENCNDLEVTNEWFPFVLLLYQPRPAPTLTQSLLDSERWEHPSWGWAQHPPFLAHAQKLPPVPLEHPLECHAGDSESCTNQNNTASVSHNSIGSRQPPDRACWLILSRCLSWPKSSTTAFSEDDMYHWKRNKIRRMRMLAM